MEACGVGGVDMEDGIIMAIIAFVGAMVPIVTVIVKLNSTITKLNTTMEVLSEQMKDSKQDRKSIHNQLSDHETRITVLEQGRRD